MLSKFVVPTTHKDKLGQILSVDDYVIHGQPGRRGVQVGRITRVMPKMIEVTSVIARTWRNYYAADTVFIDAARITFYILANSK